MLSLTVGTLLKAVGSPGRPGRRRDLFRSAMAWPSVEVAGARRLPPSSWIPTYHQTMAARRLLDRFRVTLARRLMTAGTWRFSMYSRGVPPCEPDIAVP